MESGMYLGKLIDTTQAPYKQKKKIDDSRLAECTQSVNSQTSHPIAVNSSASTADCITRHY